MNKLFLANTVSESQFGTGDWWTSFSWVSGYLESVTTVLGTIESMNGTPVNIFLQNSQWNFVDGYSSVSKYGDRLGFSWSMYFDI